jgi:hypothetical protein
MQPVWNVADAEVYRRLRDEAGSGGVNPESGNGVDNLFGRHSPSKEQDWEPWIEQVRFGFQLRRRMYSFCSIL